MHLHLMDSTVVPFVIAVLAGVSVAPTGVLAESVPIVVVENGIAKKSILTVDGKSIAESAQSRLTSEGEVPQSVVGTNPPLEVPLAVVESLERRFFDCGAAITDSTPSRRRPAATIGLSPSLFVLTGVAATEMAVLSSKGSDAASLVDLRTNEVVPTPCSLAVQTHHINQRTGSVVFAARIVVSIRIWDRQRFLWSADFHDRTMVYHYMRLPDLTRLKTFEVPDLIVDIRSLDDGSLLLITEARSTSWWSPLDWITGLAGHPNDSRSYAIEMWSVDGEKIARHVIARQGIVASARFVR